MSDELRFPGPSGPANSDSLGEPLTGLVRDAYLPAGGDTAAYWSGLEQRIMARVKTSRVEDSRWWSVLAPWAQAGMIAALAIAALSNVINQRLSETDSQYAYESVVQPPTPDAEASEAVLSATDKAASRDAALEYVLSH